MDKKLECPKCLTTEGIKMREVVCVERTVVESSVKDNGDTEVYLGEHQEWTETEDCVTFCCSACGAQWEQATGTTLSLHDSFKHAKIERNQDDEG